MDTKTFLKTSLKQSAFREQFLMATVALLLVLVFLREDMVSFVKVDNSSMPVLTLPDTVGTDTPSPQEPASAAEAASSSEEPITTIRLGVCQGITGFRPIEQLYNIPLWFDFAFPDKDVQPVPLDDKCAGAPPSAIDVIVVIGNNIEQHFIQPIRQYREDPSLIDYTNSAALNHPIKMEEIDTSTVDLVSYASNAIAISHDPGRPFVIAAHGEAYSGSNTQFDILIEPKARGQHDLSASLFWPHAARYFYEHDGWRAYRPLDLLLPRRGHTIPGVSRRFLAFMYANCDQIWYTTWHAATRVALFDTFLEKLDTSRGQQLPDALGECRKETNPDWKHSKYAREEGYLDEAVEIYRNYRFVIVMENDYVDGWWTEKMINAVMAGAIPIFAGHSELPFIAKYVNPERFVYCQLPKEKYEEGLYGGFKVEDEEYRIREVKRMQRDALEECVEKVLKIDRDPFLFHKIIDTPFLYNNTVRESIFDIRRIGMNLRKVMQDHRSYLVASGRHRDGGREAARLRQRLSGLGAEAEARLTRLANASAASLATATAPTSAPTTATAPTSLPTAAPAPTSWGRRFEEAS